MSYPHHDDRAPESHLAHYLDEAVAVFAAAGAAQDTAEQRPPSGVVSEDFEHLRWFELPASCLAAASCGPEDI